MKISELGGESNRGRGSAATLRPYAAIRDAWDRSDLGSTTRDRTRKVVAFSGQCR